MDQIKALTRDLNNAVIAFWGGDPAATKTVHICDTEVLTTALANMVAKAAWLMVRADPHQGNLRQFQRAFQQVVKVNYDGYSSEEFRQQMNPN